jgi:hypothetical protein
VKGIGWRLLLFFAFIPLALPWGVLEFVQMILAGFAWLLLGPDEGRTDRLIGGSPAIWFFAPLGYLMTKAGFKP